MYTRTAFPERLEVDLDNLEFHHFVVSQVDRTIFASARNNGRVINFLISVDGEWVKQQVNSHFEYLPEDIAELISLRASLQYGRIPTYRTRYLHFS